LFELEQEIRSRHRPHERLDAKVGKTPAIPVYDEEIVRRVIASFRGRAKTAQNDTSSIWGTLLHTKNRELLQAFDNGDEGICGAALRNPASNNLTFGMDNINLAGANLRSNENDLQSYVHLCQDNLIRLAEALGAMWLDIPNHPSWFSFASTRPDDVLYNLDRVTGTRVDFPNPFPDESGLQTDRGVCALRCIPAIYLAQRIRSLVGHLPNPRILEIGAGTGRSAYYAHRLGLKDYTVIDLPFPAGVVQGYFLLRTLGKEQVVLCGEPEHSGAVKLKDPATFFQDDQHYDLVVNMDSLTEVGVTVARDYWRKISQCCRQVFSINHEVNGFRIRDLTSPDDHITRHPDWFRSGYVEEVIRLPPSPPTKSPHRRGPTRKD
jgi:hypothetical protein